MTFPSLILTVLLLGADSSNALRKIVPKTATAAHHENGIGLPDEEPFMPPSSFENAVGITYTDGSNKDHYHNDIHSVLTDANSSRNLTASAEVWMKRSHSVNYNGIGNPGPHWVERYGRRMAMTRDGKKILVAFIRENQCGNVDLYNYVENTNFWENPSRVRDCDTSDLSFGRSVDISDDGSVWVAGAPEFTAYANCYFKIFQVDSNGNSQTAFEFRESVANRGYRLGESITISGDGKRVAVGAPGDEGSGIVGYVKIFDNIGGTWTLTKTFTGAHADDRFGYSIDLTQDGNTLVIGSPYHSSSGPPRGQAQIYRYNTDTLDWDPIGAISGSNDNERFGYSVAISDSAVSIVIGAPYYNQSKGRVQVFEYDSVNWNPKGAAFENSSSYRYGHSVSVATSGSTTTVIIGAPYHVINTVEHGHADIYLFDSTNGSSWVQTASIDGYSTGADGDFMNSHNRLKVKFGQSVALTADGKMAAVASRSYRGIFVYDRCTPPAIQQPNKSYLPSNKWYLHGSPLLGTNTDTIKSHKWGESSSTPLAMNTAGNIVAVGAHGHGTASQTNYYGLVRVFRFNGDWVQLGNDGDIPGSVQSYTGYSVSLSDDGYTVAVGAKGSKTVRVFEYDANINKWKLMGVPITSSVANFGWSVSLAANGFTVACGISHATGFAEVYQYDGNTWNRKGQSIIPPDANRNSFGQSVSISANGDVLAVGHDLYYFKPRDNYNQSIGRIIVYKFDGSTWEVYGKPIYGELNEWKLGTSLSISANGEVIATGGHTAYGWRGYIAAYKYNACTDSWVTMGSRIMGPNGGHFFQQMGYHVSLSNDGTVLATGVNGYASHLGQARVYQFDTTTQEWTPRGQFFVPPDTTEKQHFGSSIALSGDGSFVTVSNRALKVYVFLIAEEAPSSSPSISLRPSVSPSLSLQPSDNPSSKPSQSPSNNPSKSIEPSLKPSTSPSAAPSVWPSDIPSANPSVNPSVIPSTSPSQLPSRVPTVAPTSNPSSKPSVMPTKKKLSNKNLPSTVPTNPGTSIPSIEPSLIPSNVNDIIKEIVSAKPSIKTDSNLSTAPYSTPLVTQTTSMYIAFSAQMNDLENLSNPQVQQNIATGIGEYLVRELSLEKATVQLSIYDQANGNVSDSNVKTQVNGRKLQTDEGAVKLVAIIQSTAALSNSGNMSERISDLIRNDITDFPDVVKTSAGGFLDSLVGHIASLEDIYPSLSPSAKPSLEPTSEPSSFPSSNPSKFPSNLPSTLPSFVPSSVPSIAPSGVPTDSPSMKTHNDANGSSESPYVVKNVSFTPSVNPTNEINGIPSHGNSLNKTTRIPSASPSVHPSVQTFYRSAEPSMADSKILRKAQVAAVAAGCGAAAASAAASASGGAAAAASSSASSSSSAASSSTGTATMSATTSAAASSSGGIQTGDERPRMNLQEMQAMRLLDARNRNNTDADSDDDEEEHSTNNDIEMNLGQQDALQNEDDINANVVIESDNSNPILRNTETNTQDTSNLDNSTNENESSIDVRERRSNDEHNTSLNNQLENETNLTVEKEGIDSFDLSNEKHSAGDTYARVEGGTASLRNNSYQDRGKSKNDGIEKSDVAKSTGEEFSSTRSATNDAKSVDQSAEDNRIKSPSLPHDQSNDGADQSYSVNDEVQQESHSIEQSTPNEHVGKSDITQAEASGIDNTYSKEVSDLPFDDNKQEPHSIEQSSPSEHVGKSDSTSKPSVVQAEERGMQSHANNDVEVSDSGNNVYSEEAPDVAGKREPNVEDKYARVEGGTATLSNNHNKDSSSAVKGKEAEELQVDSESAVESTSSEMKFVDKLLLAEGALEDGVDTSLFEKYDDNKKSINKFMERVSTSNKSGNNLDTIHDDDDVDKKGRVKFKRSNNTDNDVLGVHFTVAIGITKLLLDAGGMEETLVVRRKDASPKMPSKLGRYFNFFGRKQHIREEKSTIEAVKELADEENQLNFLNNDGDGGVSASSSAFRSSAIQGLLDDVESSAMFNQRT